VGVDFDGDPDKHPDVGIFKGYIIYVYEIVLNRGVRLAKNDFGSLFGSVLQKTAVFGSVSVFLVRFLHCVV